MSKNIKNNQQQIKCKNCVKNLQQLEQNFDINDANKQNNENLSIIITQEEINELKLTNSQLLEIKNNFDLNNNEEKNIVFLKTTNLENDWQNKNYCIIERLSHMYLNEDLADVYFIVGRFNEKRERIVAHKFILSIGSKVFNTMFYGTGQFMNKSNEIEIPDIDVKSFKSFLRYLYTDEINIEAETVMSILYISKKYSVSRLENACVEYLKQNLRIDNAFMLLQQAKLFDEIHLADLCLNLIDKYSNETLETDYFLDIDLSLLKLILNRDSLNIRESKLYEYVIKWAHKKCQIENFEINRENLRSVLSDAINLIRYPLMTKEEFGLIVSSKENRLLDDEQIIDIFLYLTMNNPKRETQFNAIPRYGKYKQSLYSEQIINRFCQVESRWGYSGTSDRIRFSVDRHIYVIGIGLYGSIYGKCEYQVFIQILQFETFNVCAQNNTQFLCDGSNSTFRVLFREPVKIEPHTDYILAATLKGPDSYYGTKGMKTITHENEINDNKVTFQFQYASGNNNGSSVEDGQLPEIIFVYNI